MKRVFCVVLILLFAHSSIATLSETESDDIGRSLFLTLDRNQEFYRQEDRSRC